MTVIPGGATFFTSKGSGPEFGNYTYGGALTYNINQFVGVEREVGGSVGIAQNLQPQHSVVPYVAGVKWYAPDGRWGLRGDYRFIAVRSDDSAPAFFGRDSRYGHRVYGAVVINALR
jgi:hypothetical protein